MISITTWAAGNCKQKSDFHGPGGRRRPACLPRVALIILALVFIRPAVAQNGEYHVGPRDILRIAIHAGGEEQINVTVTVSSDGAINIPFIGQISAVGHTLTALESIISKDLGRDYFISPEVFISVAEYHSLQYYISGAVASPGLYEMSSRSTLLELIVKAGGVTDARGNVAYVLRGLDIDQAREVDSETLLAQKEPIRIDLDALLDQGDLRSNMLLESGDMVHIPLEKTLNLTASKIWVGGVVKKPGAFDFQPGMTALGACLMAGGFDKFAAPNRAHIVRTRDGQSEVIRIDLEDVKDGKIPDIQLQPGDRIHVPESYL